MKMVHTRSPKARLKTRRIYTSRKKTRVRPRGRTLRTDQPANRRMTTLCLAGEARNSGLAISICLEVADALHHVATLLHRLLTCKPAWIVHSDHARAIPPSSSQCPPTRQLVVRPLH